MKSLTKFSFAALAAAAMATPAVTSSGQTVVQFDFRTNGGAGGALGADPAGTDFDPSGVGDTVTVGGLTATLVDLTAPEFDVSGEVPVLTGNTLSGAEGGVVTNVSGQDSLGIQNPSISNTQFSVVGGGSESSDINVGETFTISFDQDVVFTEIELESIVATDGFDVLVDGVALLTTLGDDSFIDDLQGLAGFSIAAGSEITFSASAGDLATSSFRIETFTVTATPIPEPASLALLGLGGLAICGRRKRA